MCRTGRAAERPREILTPPFDRRSRGAGFIAQIVAITHERVDGAHAVLLLRREKDKRIIEVFCACSRDLRAVGVRIAECHAARPTVILATEASSSPMRSSFEMDGRRRRTS